MNNSVIVRIGNCLRDNTKFLNSVAGGELISLKHGRQSFTFDELHRNKRLALKLTNFIDWDNSKVVQTRRGIRLV